MFYHPWEVSKGVQGDAHDPIHAFRRLFQKRQRSEVQAGGSRNRDLGARRGGQICLDVGRSEGRSSVSGQRCSWMSQG